MSRPEGHTLRRRLAGVVFVLVPALLIWLAVAVYDKKFTDSDPVVVETGSAGNQMHPGAEVKLRGVVVGEVRAIDATGDGARLTLAMKPGALDDVPSDVRAQMLPTTLFGERFVALVPPANPSPEPLAAGAVVPQDRSANAIELQQVLDDVLPMLTAVQPQKLSATLSAVSQALEGRGERLGDTLTLLDEHLAEFNPNLPALNRDLKELVKVSHVYADAAPDVITALTDFTTTSGTLAEQEADLAATLGATTRTAEDVTAFLHKNKDNIIRLGDTSRPTLELLAEYSPAFPCTLRTLAEFVPAMDKRSARAPTGPASTWTSPASPRAGPTDPAATPRCTTPAAGPAAPRCPTSARCPGPPPGPPPPRPSRTSGPPTPRRRTTSSTNSWPPPPGRAPVTCPTGAACSSAPSTEARR